MLTLVVDGKEYTCEANWNELSQERMLGLMRLEYAHDNVGAKLWSRVCYMLRLNAKQKKELAKLPPVALHDIATRPDCLGWINMDDALLEEYTLKGFWHRGLYYCGPPKRMLRIAAKELVMVHTYFGLYHRTKEQEHLTQVMALLYRPINPLWWLNAWREEWTGDKRLPLNDWSLQRRAKAFKKLDVALVMAAVKQLSGALQMFESRFKKVFTRGKNENTQGAGGWVNLLFALSGGAFGNFKETENTDAQLLFMKIQYDMEQHELQMQELKKKK